MEVKPFAEQGRYTQMHNLLFDIVMPAVGGSAWKVLCFIARNTKGRHLKNDAFSYAQIKAGTGINTDATVNAALQQLLSSELFGNPILRRKTAAERDVSRREATRYALNPDFTLLLPESLRSSKIEVRTAAVRSSKIEEPEKIRSSKIEVSGSSKIDGRNGPHYESDLVTSGSSMVAGKESYKESGARESERDNLPRALTREAAIDFSSPLIAALCDVCALMPNAAALNAHQQADLPATAAWLLENVDPDPAAAAALLRERFARWGLKTRPHLSQIRSEWRRMELAAQEQKTSTTNGNGYKSAAERQAEARRREAEMMEQIREGTFDYGTEH